jgi:hypothetical protein
MKKVYHHYKKWEDNTHGMFLMKCDDEESKVKKSIFLLSHPKLLKKYMMITSNKWVYSAEMNLSNKNMNRQAWLGKSACCLYSGAPEYVTASAWKSLTENQRTKANAVADEVIAVWESNYEKVSRS